MFGGFGFGQSYFAGLPLITTDGGATTVIGEPPIRIRRVTSRATSAANVSDGIGTLRRKTSGRTTLKNVEQSD